ncbi:histidine phosphatase family protein [Cohnella nanjingensis]|uniref:Histidine phosphatase family protein n=1 Tax=Cohnella nanjingensis TaxID=1387779 RepID=A0A7X0RX54_9BACL|nr:histidine phosphatase family protein [Cohnella nanjingensis]MBB6673714.1 histidine phosphatase family protein [Cohnella nanjingensis]
MKNVYLVRHCQAEGQAPDAPLTDEGNRQALRLASFLADREIDCLISSPYERAYRTVQPLAERLGIEVVLDARLTERVLSAENHPAWRDRLRETFADLDLRYEGGESSREATGRAVGVVDEVLRGAYRDAVIVSHGNLISLLLKHFDDRIGFEEWAALSNPDVYRLVFADDTPSIRRIWTE